MTRLQERGAIAVLLAGTAIAYVWGLGRAGWANAFYSAAVQAGTVSWKALFFGSSDGANSITVDKPPASLWVMELSTRIFGVNSWAMLVPQALLGVAAVALLYATVRRRFGAVAGLLAGLILAVTPVAAMMFRFNNPDALLVLLMIAATWAMLRAVEDGRWRWLIVCGAFVGVGFLTKQLAVMLIVPGLALTYLVAGPPKIGVRIAQLFAAGTSMIVAAGWWLLTVELWPAASRPWIGGSQNNSILELTLGYNGLGRLNGDEKGSVGPGRSGMEVPAGFELPPGIEMPDRHGGGMFGDAGALRMFAPAQAGQIAWLLPAALIAFVLVLVLRRSAPRTDGDRAAVIAWGGWLLVTGVTFSFMAGIFHPYYTVALAPAIAALVAIGTTVAWRERDRTWVRVVGALAVAATGATGWYVLDQTPNWNPWLRWAIAAAALVSAVAILATAAPAIGRTRRLTATIAVTALFAALAGQVAFTAETIASPRQGAIVSAGPSSGHGFGPGRGRGRMDRSGGGTSFLQGSTAGPKVTALLLADADRYTWVAATVGANAAAGYQLATARPVMPVGGFNGTDPSPTLDRFQQYVRDGRIHYFLAESGSGFGGFGGSGTASQIRSWVETTFSSRTVDGVTVYDLTAPTR
ncbi:Glycosyl transferase family 39 OS=Tsukamurella paurometabola (strain ATCC 8368 / DSM / CCUG 35730 / CIP 100753 / JCM 10117 / KCTC 9821 / NBRC 16120 / NCIMB 702349 / NCTC 13040) OX=521096 GN=Tpau_1938 PE=4 SV=1 [Tsukamurella paurometabola]|uniref:Glycosyl transferase family 39 n=1 Tax=Tsukamurella paurometabola (strain ATCC 8368 / DSM 20162 / CCUG 35730 / CIP 100753 / JCM 10117 / KCTC 9821 / NBRC 16120 / NCIMB 702349 / NCTC 13040) TaxID=521096 RepID=D5UN54_TSUPD|nr:glycosyltransferase family 39 protein [Tsukamurella paurometabola]ADG78551.1 glycosyl transferase family 39 [Tsukamurella paurometabola DSM 20162]SUP32145.1 Predicted membrane protein [Tsukamurella paurometabola]